MIGVCVQEADRTVVVEFFELFKTPWEFFRDGGSYDVLLCGEGIEPPVAAALIVLTGASARPSDPAGARSSAPSPRPAVLKTKGGPLALTGGYRFFQTDAVAVASLAEAEGVVAFRSGAAESALVCLGFDLFAEVRQLLTTGQPGTAAPIPSLDRHIALLREAILDAGLPLVEIPPSPVGHPFIACLSHDVDHVGIRNHKADHTMFGFLYRATAGSVVNWLRGRLTARQMLTNWVAAGSLPFVHLGWARDFWFQFDRYLEIEEGRKSTYFVIPRPGIAGQAVPGNHGPAPAARAASYDATSLTPYLDRLRSGGCEIALHGLDAWCDPSKGREEAAVIAGLAGQQEIGVRMHWLYFDEAAPARLEAAGFSYDSTVGYNEAVGYRAGTSQVYRPLGVESLLELPLHIMDTALFYPSRMNLGPEAARAAVAALIDISEHAGGVLTVNWHDRSLAPERLWEGFYISLMDELQSRGAWFATAAETIAWFRERRAAHFDSVTWQSGAVHITTSGPQNPDLPELRLRIHRPGRPFVDVPLAREVRVS